MKKKREPHAAQETQEESPPQPLASTRPQQLEEAPDLSRAREGGRQCAEDSWGRDGWREVAGVAGHVCMCEHDGAYGEGEGGGGVDGEMEMWTEDMKREGGGGEGGGGKRMCCWAW
eukprot:CAMPEP_0206485100 /NCGR_PEP_ID=MMETSP0324_2-20121206/40337_1 /ASSEMBLY_ACC=CAM_ASM_000836 /TAXON_ID=2866 /ORGANISM="Crypthecodinium cohnii, Strain Seligo" /LENGTH=115 /DNA_ID=CAMNT_0053963311 /DNA_START=189 /DNA_END=538 /DNA_ORIENTATION=-